MKNKRLKNYFVEYHRNNLKFYRLNIGDTDYIWFYKHQNKWFARYMVEQQQITSADADYKDTMLDAVNYCYNKMWGINYLGKGDL